MEHYVLWFFILITAASAFFWLRQERLKDWVIVFLLNAFISFLLDSFVVAYHLIEYPVRILPQVFDIHIVFDFLVFPTLCVFYNKTTYHSRWQGILLQAVLYSLAIGAIEYWGVTSTRLIVYHNWNIGLTFLFLILTFLLVRILFGIVRMVSKP